MTTQTQLKKQLINQIKNCWHPQEIGAHCFCREINCSYPNCQARSLTLKTIDRHFQKKHAPIMLNTNNSQLFQYHQQNYTCDKCQQDFQKTTAYSPADKLEELAQHPTYCPNCAKVTSLVPITTSKQKPKSKKNTVAYYQCLSACCQQGISPKTITQVAQECKHNSFGILAQRTNEIQKLNQAYRQIGESLTSLLQPIKEE